MGSQNPINQGDNGTTITSRHIEHMPIIFEPSNNQTEASSGCASEPFFQTCHAISKQTIVFIPSIASEVLQSGNFEEESHCRSTEKHEPSTPNQRHEIQGMRDMENLGENQHFQFLFNVSTSSNPANEHDLGLAAKNADASTPHDDQQIHSDSVWDENTDTNPMEIANERNIVPLTAYCEREQLRKGNGDPATLHVVTDAQQYPDTVHLILDDDEAVRQNGNNAGQRIDDVNARLQPPKHQSVKASVCRNSKKKTTLTKATDKAKKRFKCDFCACSTNQRHHFNEHIYTHTNERPYECEICEKCFAQKGSLRRHKRAHRNAYAFHCLNCRQGFSDQRARELHENRCKIRQYECYVCKEKYVDKDTLFAHICRVHTGEASFSCSKCSRKYYYSRDLRTHLREFH